MNKIKNILTQYATLAKLRITVPVALSAFLGFVLARPEISLYSLAIVSGVFFLACGSAALNQLQEKSEDGKMNRTSKRPLPSKNLTTEKALIFTITMSVIGVFLLSLSFNLWVIGLGLLTLFWYNAVYTPLKKRTPLAVFPGAVIGALPPLIGWMSGGGAITNLQIWAVCLFFFIWQIPHFWFLFLIYEEDYKRGGFPTLTDIFSHKQIQRISYAWIAALSSSCLLIPFFGVTSSPITYLVLFGLGAVLLWRTKGLVFHYYSKQTTPFRFAFRDINIYVLVVVIILSFDKLLNH